MSMVRRTRWNPPPPPTPRILNLPRRIRRKSTKGKPLEKDAAERSSRGKLESLFDQERVFAKTIPIVLLNEGREEECERRERVEVSELRDGDKEEDNEQELWRFQAEILRAECNFLRVERDIAVKKLELNRIQTKRRLRSAVETLVSGKEKIDGGKSVSCVLEEEIEDLQGKLKELQRSSVGVRDFDFNNCSSNFDTQAFFLQTKLDKLGQGLLAEEKCVKQIRDMAEASLTIKTSSQFDQSVDSVQANRFSDVEILRRKMERLSTGMLERMEEEYGSMLSSATSSGSTSRRIQFPLLSSSAQFQSLLGYKESKSKEDKECSGRCKKIVRKIVEQVRAEMEQWSLMQETLERVREEMEDLQCSRDFWQDRALDSDQQLENLQFCAQEWKLKAKHAENKVAELEKHNSELHLELKRIKKIKNASMGKPREMIKEKEKHVLICRLKENHHRCGNESKSTEKQQREQSGGSSNGIPKRQPLGEMPNSSPLPWDNRFRVPFAMP